MQIDHEDDEPEYGTWEFTAEDALNEERKLLPNGPKLIWPHWDDGVPTKLSRTGYSPAFANERVHHRSREYCETLELQWTRPCELFDLTRSNYRLPSNSEEHQWSGVYRIFLQDVAIDRLCGKDPTGTLYIGRAGTGQKSWSILRNRLLSAARGDHHATAHWHRSDAIRKRFGAASVEVQWAYTGTRRDYRGDIVLNAVMAEYWLLTCYRDSYGEFPPLNKKA